MSGFAKISDLLQRATDAGDVPGVAVAVATPDGVAFEGAAGKRDLDSGAAMAPDTVVRIASMTKAITGACAMQLVEQGKLELDAPIAKLLPKLGEAMVFEGYDADGKPKLRAPKRPITLRHLLTHTSGHTYDIWNATIAEYKTKAGTYRRSAPACSRRWTFRCCSIPASSGSTASASTGRGWLSSRSPG